MLTDPRKAILGTWRPAQLEQQLFPGTYRDDPKRKYRFFDDKLLLEPLDKKDHEILWQRATA